MAYAATPVRLIGPDVRRLSRARPSRTRLWRMALYSPFSVTRAGTIPYERGVVSPRQGPRWEPEVDATERRADYPSWLHPPVMSPSGSTVRASLSRLAKTRGDWALAIEGRALTSPGLSPSAARRSRRPVPFNISWVIHAEVSRSPCHTGTVGISDHRMPFSLRREHETRDLGRGCYLGLRCAAGMVWREHPRRGARAAAKCPWLSKWRPKPRMSLLPSS